VPCGEEHNMNLKIIDKYLTKYGHYAIIGLNHELKRCLKVLGRVSEKREVPMTNEMPGVM
jgi:hypothetical protein